MMVKLTIGGGARQKMKKCHRNFLSENIVSLDVVVLLGIGTKLKLGLN